MKQDNNSMFFRCLASNTVNFPHKKPFFPSSNLTWKELEKRAAQLTAKITALTPQGTILALACNSENVAEIFVAFIASLSAKVPVVFLQGAKSDTELAQNFILTLNTLPISVCLVDSETEHRIKRGIRNNLSKHEFKIHSAIQSCKFLPVLCGGRGKAIDFSSVPLPNENAIALIVFDPEIDKICTFSCHLLAAQCEFVAKEIKPQITDVILSLLTEKLDVESLIVNILLSLTVGCRTCVRASLTGDFAKISPSILVVPDDKCLGLCNIKITNNCQSVKKVIFSKRYFSWNSSLSLLERLGLNSTEAHYFYSASALGGFIVQCGKGTALFPAGLQEKLQSRAIFVAPKRELVNACSYGTMFTGNASFWASWTISSAKELLLSFKHNSFFSFTFGPEECAENVGEIASLAISKGTGLYKSGILAITEPNMGMFLICQSSEAVLVGEGLKFSQHSVQELMKLNYPAITSCLALNLPFRAEQALCLLVKMRAKESQISLNEKLLAQRMMELLQESFGNAQPLLTLFTNENESFEHIQSRLRNGQLSFKSITLNAAKEQIKKNLQTSLETTVSALTERTFIGKGLEIVKKTSFTPFVANGENEQPLFLIRLLRFLHRDSTAPMHIFMNEKMRIVASFSRYQVLKLVNKILIIFKKREITSGKVAIVFTRQSLLFYAVIYAAMIAGLDLAIVPFQDTFSLHLAELHAAFEFERVLVTDEPTKASMNSTWQRTIPFELLPMIHNALFLKRSKINRISHAQCKSQTDNPYIYEHSKGTNTICQTFITAHNTLGTTFCTVNDLTIYCSRLDQKIIKGTVCHTDGAHGTPLILSAFWPIYKECSVSHLVERDKPIDWWLWFKFAEKLKAQTLILPKSHYSIRGLSLEHRINHTRFNLKLIERLILLSNTRGTYSLEDRLQKGLLPNLLRSNSVWNCWECQEYAGGLATFPLEQGPLSQPLLLDADALSFGKISACGVNSLISLRPCGQLFDGLWAQAKGEGSLILHSIARDTQPLETGTFGFFVTHMGASVLFLTGGACEFLSLANGRRVSVEEMRWLLHFEFPVLHSSTKIEFERLGTEEDCSLSVRVHLEARIARDEALRLALGVLMKVLLRWGILVEQVKICARTEDIFILK